MLIVDGVNDILKSKQPYYYEETEIILELVSGSNNNLRRRKMFSGSNFAQSWRLKKLVEFCSLAFYCYFC